MATRGNSDPRRSVQPSEVRGKHAAPMPLETGAAMPEVGYGELAYQLDKDIRRKRKWTVVFVLALIVFLASLAGLGIVAFSYLQGQQKYGDVAELAALGDLESQSEADIVGAGSGAGSVNVDWDALLAANPDTVAWVYMPGTRINYPVVQGKDNEYYLTHDFDGDAGWLANYGAIFMDYRNRPGWKDPSYFLFGHHMQDGSMFADLAALTGQAKFDECRTSYVLSSQGNFKLRTFALVHCAPEDAIVMTGFVDKAQMNEYIQDKMDRSVVSVADAPEPKDMGMIFAFATCDSESWGRYVLFSYVESTSVKGLNAKIGIDVSDDGAVSLVDEVSDGDAPGGNVSPSTIPGVQSVNVESSGSADSSSSASEQS